MKKLFLSLSAIAALAMTSCSKDDESSQITPTKENLSGTYVMTGATLKVGSTEMNVFNNADASMNWYEACDRDDQYKLNINLSYEVVDAGAQCSPDNNSMGTWDLVNSSTIQLDGEQGTITSFDGKTLVVSVTDSGSTLTTTMVKQ